MSVHRPAAGAEVRQETPSGLIALVVGIVGLFVAQPIVPIVALIFGYRSRREAQANPEVYRDGYGKAGRVLGWIGVVLGVVAIIVLLMFWLAW